MHSTHRIKPEDKIKQMDRIEHGVINIRKRKDWVVLWIWQGEDSRKTKYFVILDKIYKKN